MTTFKKLNSGDWGLIGSADEIQAGRSVKVTKRSGQTKTVTVGKVLWSGDGKAIATIAGGNGSSRSYRRGRTGQYANGYCYYPCPVTGRKCCPENGPCHDCE